LRFGYTTGACAAAAAKAAALGLFAGRAGVEVNIPFPDGSRVAFALCRALPQGADGFLASVVKDAGDDPDVTNGAEIVALAQRPGAETDTGACLAIADAALLELCAGSGVGTVTKPGLAVAVGEPAINPVPRRMIAQAVAEAWAEIGAREPLRITISIPGGEHLAEKTLNRRLGVVGGLSILGTTGIVRPVSAEAWTATIAAAMSVARAAGLDEIVLATGRSSERAAQDLLRLPEEALVTMGDYLEFALLEAGRQGFARIHLAAMWAKAVKAALRIPQTHVRHGALEVAAALPLLAGLGADPALLAGLGDANTARELYERLKHSGRDDLIRGVCGRAREYAESTAGVPVRFYLVDVRGRVVERA